MTEPSMVKDHKPFDRDTLDREALYADVLTRMFGDDQPEPLLMLGRYQIQRKLGEGGMGEVYLALDPELDRKVAIKLLRNRPEGFSEREEERMRREARAMARVNHAHVIHVHDVGRYQSRLFLAMEYIDGPTITQWLGSDRSTAEIIEVYVDAGEGLAAAHEAGLIHRDFKPDNVMIGSDGRVRVTDFGIAVSMESWQELVSRTDEQVRGRSVAGTLRYMSPEQVRGQSLDARSDQFSFCVALLEALTGQHPFTLLENGELTRGLISGERRPLPPGHGVPATLIAVLERGISLSPEERWPSMRALLNALTRDPAAKRRRWALGAALALGVGLVAFAAGQRTATEADPCAEGATAVEQTWGPEQRQALADRFAFQAYGPSSFAVVETALDDWSRQWSESYEGLCRSRHERSEDRYEMRMDCLGQQRHQLGVWVEQLTQAGPAQVSEAPRWAQQISDPTQCVEDPLELEPPPPTIANEVARIREELATIETKLDLGHPVGVDVEHSHEQLERLREQADAMGYLPLVVEVAWVQRAEASIANDRQRCRELLELVYGLGTQTRHDRLALHAAITMLIFDVDSVPNPRSERTREIWNTLSLHLSARLGSPLREELVRYRLYILRLREHGRRTQQVQQLEQALALLRGTVGLDHPLAIEILTERAQEHLQRNELGDALTVLDRVDAIIETWLGSEHPLRAEPLSIRADVLSMRGRHEESLQVAQRAYRSRTAAYGKNDPKAQRALDSIAQAHDALGHHAEARDTYEAMLGPSPSVDTLPADRIGTVNSLCFVQYKLRDYSEAIETCELALAAAKRRWPDGHALEAIVLNNLALIARAQGRFEAGLAFDRKALAVCESLDPTLLRAKVYAWIGIGEGLLALGRADEAIDPLQHALEVRQREAPDSPEHGEALCLMAQARWETEVEARPDAQEQAERGLERLDAGGLGWTPQADACRTWLEQHGGVLTVEPG